MPTATRVHGMHARRGTMLASLAEGMCLTDSLGLQSEQLIEILGLGAMVRSIVYLCAFIRICIVYHAALVSSFWALGSDIFYACASICLSHHLSCACTAESLTGRHRAPK
jgi:hypothetical protein